MKKTLFILAALFSFVIYSCDDDDMAGPDAPTKKTYADLDVVTGLDLSDENGNSLGKWNFPNHKPGQIQVFPNPNSGVASVVSFSQQKVVRIWLIPATCLVDSLTADIPALSANLTYEVSELESAQIKDISVTDFSFQVQLDFSDVPKGLYRLFYQIEGGELFWENMYIDPTVSNFPTLDFLDGLCD